ncbi:MAG: hypothetical protein V4793_29210 [Paraburkholderia tropica]|uniref:Uncharacterized protein n=1 Tax=Paraburkholderia tropica TaxID=92647 RepID=A0ABX5MF39_9BURK|nr:hypothetical protein [Paraburkholderia tropica]MBB2984243.1 hypothetical protein [Paraburkholderia tropica]MBB3004987.1 hypothetical protein [Paraburkholderia tropica]MBB6323275.1 hypothetical protein [Paraburkholderia tropica]PXX05073.1 hypothetical protein C7400_14440 [Paraburkholderia tropica]PZW70501.1 hypothetical protein C7399_14440 [Paraburkholderia tropica]
MFKKHLSAVCNTTIAVRAAAPRRGAEHVYTLNGSRLRDVLVDGHWITVTVSEPVAQRAAA